MDIRLVDLLMKMPDNTLVWVATSAENEEGLFFGYVGDIKLSEVRGYTVSEIYPEWNSAHYRAGITVIVESTEGR